MAPSIEDILTPYTINPDSLERINHRKTVPPLVIVESKPEWPLRFEEVKNRVQAALGDLIVDIVRTSYLGLESISDYGRFRILPDVR